MLCFVSKMDSYHHHGDFCFEALDMYRYVESSGFSESLLGIFCRESVGHNKYCFLIYRALFWMPDQFSLGDREYVLTLQPVIIMGYVE